MSKEYGKFLGRKLKGTFLGFVILILLQPAIWLLMSKEMIKGFFKQAKAVE